jgi:hypothetical protein
MITEFNLGHYIFGRRTFDITINLESILDLSFSEELEGETQDFTEALKELEFGKENKII